MLQHRRRPRPLGALLTLSLLAPLQAALLPSASAQTAAPAAGSATAQADALFREARSMLDQLRYEEACRLFERSQELDPSPGTLLNLGDCYERRDDLARALSTFERSLSDMQAERYAAKRKTWLEVATKRRDALAARVPLLILEPSPTAGAVVRVDGRELLQLELRLNPGQHRLEVTAPQKLPHTRKVDLKVGQPPLEISLPALADLPESNAPAATLPFGTPPFAAATSSPSDEQSAGKSVGPWVFLGVGAALGVTSLITFGMAASKEDDLDQNCAQANVAGNRVCNPDLADAKSSGEGLATATYVLWAGTAITGLIGGIWLGVDSANTRDAGSAARVSGGCFGTGCALSLAGQF